MKITIKRVSSFILAVSLCVVLNFNPLAYLLYELANSPIVSKLGNIGDNLVLYACGVESRDLDVVKADDVVIDVSGIIRAIREAETNNENDRYNNTVVITDVSVKNTENIVGAITNFDKRLNENVLAVGDTLLNQLQESTKQIVETIKAQQHQYKVCYLYSVNNANNQVLWRPTLDELPNAEVLPYITTGYANVYSGFWDAGIDNMTNKGVSQDAFGIKDIAIAGDDVQRACNILGYDIIVRNEGFYGAAGSNLGTYVQTLIPDGDITWGDAVQIIYKALGEYQYNYSYFTTSANIQPETSPLSQDLSNITTFDTSEGAYYLFVSRSDRLTGPTLTTLDNVYWTKAQNDGLVRKDDYSNYITWSDFIVLCSRMAELYGEPVLTDAEENALLQVYGLQYPSQLGREVAQAWCYLKARGILSFDDISYASAMDRNSALDIAMRIADKDSRLDYKNIQLTMDIGDSLSSGGFYPGANMKYSADTFAVSREFDHAAVESYDYYFLASSVDFGSVKDTDGTTHNISPNFVTKENKRQNSLKATDSSGLEISGSKYLGIYTDGDKNRYYHFKVPKSFKDVLRIAPNNATDYPRYIEVGTSDLGGGIYSGYALNSNNHEALQVASAGHYLFESMKNASEWLANTDFKRALQPDPSKTALGLQPTIFESIEYAWNKITSPIEVKAATGLIDNGRLNITFSKDDDADKSEFEIGALYEKANSSVSFLNRCATVMSDTNWMSYLESCSTSDKYTKDMMKIFKAALETDYSQALNPYKQYDGKLYQIYHATNLSIGTANIPGWDGVETDEPGFTFCSFVLADMNASNGLYDTKNIPPGISQRHSVLKTMLDKSVGKDMHKKGGYLDKALSTIESQLPQIYEFIKTNKCKEIDAVYTANSPGDSSTDVPLGKKLTYHVFTEDGNGFNNMKTIVGTVAGKDPLGATTSTSTSSTGDPNSSTAVDATGELATTVATSSILNKNRDDNILLAWDDLKTTGIVVDTFGGNQPTPDEDGIYYLQSKNGLIKIWPSFYTILIGTTFYNLKGQDEAGPLLVFIDSQTGKVYFDYRCIMGVVNLSISETGTTVTKADNSVGAGTQAIYSFNSSGVSNNIYDGNSNITTYNWPNIPSSKSSLDVDYMKTQIITDTMYDGQEYTDPANVSGNNFVYHADGVDYNFTRVPLANFYATANWITVIKTDESGTKAGLFVYYPRTAFVNESESLKVQWNDKITNVNMEEFTDNGSELNDSLAEKIEEYKKQDGWNNEVNWYDAMTYHALVNFYKLTGGGFFADPQYSIRYIDLTNNSAVQCFDAHGVDGVGEGANKVLYNGNEAGRIYWLEYVGFVYNVPKLSDFKFGDYMMGDYPLPIVWDYDQSSGNRSFLLVNPDYYSTINDGSTDYEGFGYSIGPAGVYDVCQINNGKCGLISEWPGDTNGVPLSPYSPSNLVYAPSGVYAFIGGYNTPYITSKSFTKYSLSQNHVYLGSQRMYWSDKYSNKSEPEFYRGSDLIAPFELDGNYKFYRVYEPANNQYIYVSVGAEISIMQQSSIKDVKREEILNTDFDLILENWNFKNLINSLDEWSSFVILAVFYILPIIAYCWVTLLLGLSFLTNNEIAEKLAGSVIDPIYFLTFHFRDMNTLRFKDAFKACLICYIVISCIFNANIVKVTSWMITFVQTAKELFMQFN